MYIKQGAQGAANNELLLATVAGFLERTGHPAAASATRASLEKSKRANDSAYGVEMMSAARCGAVLNVQDL